MKTKATKGPVDPQEPVKKPGASQARAPLAGDTMEKPVELPEGMRERVAKKARELWDLRGWREGHDLQDWFDAEAVVMEEIHETCE